MNPQDDSSFDELLRSAMAEEADGVVPAGDGLARIQQRIRHRENRVKWFRPALALGSAALVAGAGVGAAVLVGHSGNDKLSPSPATGASLEPTASSTTVPIVSHEPFPALAIFPFTTATAEQGWQQDYDHGTGTQWETIPTEVAMRWVDDFLGQPSIDRVVSQSDDNGDRLVTLGRVMQAESHAVVSVTTVRLTQYDEAWIVTGASDPQSLLSFNSPMPGSTITTPVTITGPAFGVDEAAKLDVRDATSTTSYGTYTASFGNGSDQWVGRINFNRATSPVGTLVATVFSAADGGPSRIAAEQVRFAPAGEHQPPPYFYAVKNNRIAQFASRTGDSIKYLTSEQPGGGLSDPQLYGDNIYYLQGAGTCANALMKVAASADGSASGDIVASPDKGYVISAYAVWVGAPTDGYSLVESACDPARSPQGRLVTQEGEHRNAVDFPAFPPEIVSDPSYELPSNLTLLDAIVRTGNQGYIARYDAYTETSPTPNRTACKGLGPEDGQPQAIEMDSTGTLWIALQTGTSMDVVQCSQTGSPKSAFTVPGNDQPADLDVANDGSAVLLTDVNGKVWRWDGSGNPEVLSTSIPLQDVTW